MPVNDVVDINDDDDVDDNGVDDGVGFDIIIIGDIIPIGVVADDINIPDVPVIVFVVAVDVDDVNDDAQPKSLTVGVDGIDDDELFCAAIFDQDIPPLDAIVVVVVVVTVEPFTILATDKGLFEFKHIVSIDCDGVAD